MLPQLLVVQILQFFGIALPVGRCAPYGAILEAIAPLVTTFHEIVLNVRLHVRSVAVHQIRITNGIGGEVASHGGRETIVLGILAFDQ